MKHSVFVGALLALVMTCSFLQQVTAPQVDDFAVMKYLAHADSANNAALLSAAHAATNDQYELDRYGVRIQTQRNYLFVTALIRGFDARFSQYSFLSVFLAFGSMMALSLGFYLFMRSSYPVPIGSSIDLALVLVGFTLLLDFHGISRAYPFGSGAPWYDIFPRGWIELLYISLLYPFLSPDASPRVRTASLIGVTVVALLFNALFALMIIGLGAAAWALSRIWYPFRFEYLFPALYLVFIVAFRLSIDVGPEFVIRAAIWIASTCALLYCTRDRQRDVTRNALVFLAAVSLASYFFNFNFSSQTDAGVFQFTGRATGLAQFAFFLFCANLLAEQKRILFLKYSAAPLLILLVFLLMRHPSDRLLAKLPQFQTIPAPAQETEFFQYFTERSLSGQTSSLPPNSAALPR